MALTDASNTVNVELKVNGKAVNADVDPRLLLSDYLRHELRLTGTHVGCEQGVCGCCTVHIDGHPARSCLTLVGQLDGSEIRTVEDLAGADGQLHVVQEAFHNNHALQCGFCTPGFLMSIVGHIEHEENPDLSDEGIRDAISGNLCRCTGYQNIVSAVREAIEGSDR